MPIFNSSSFFSSKGDTVSKKQILTLSLLLCPFLHQEPLQAGILRKLALVSVASGIIGGTTIYRAGERIKTRPLEQQTTLAKNGYVFLDGALESAQNMANVTATFFSKSITSLGIANKALQEQRDTVLPEFIKEHNPLFQSIRELETVLNQSKKESGSGTSLSSIDDDKK